MEAIHLQKSLKKDGEILVTGLPLKKGEQVEMILLFKGTGEKTKLTAQSMLDSELIGMWKNRKDVIDSPLYARQLRNRAQYRKGGDDIS